MVVEEFAKLFKEATLPNSATFDTNKNNEFSDKIKTYIGHSLSQDYLCNAELVAMALMKMEKGKSPGVDKLTVEHFNHCHPVIFTLLANLFNAMLGNSFVPSDFGRGITIPIPKGEGTNGTHAIVF